MTRRELEYQKQGCSEQLVRTPHRCIEHTWCDGASLGRTCKRPRYTDNGQETNSRSVRHRPRKATRSGNAGVLDVKEAGDNWIFTYRGPGNGSLGLSQHGANMFANRGWKFHQILQQYYQDPDGRLRLDIMDKYENVRGGAAELSGCAKSPLSESSTSANKRSKRNRRGRQLICLTSVR